MPNWGVGGGMLSLDLGAWISKFPLHCLFSCDLRSDSVTVTIRLPPELCFHETVDAQSAFVFLLFLLVVRQGSRVKVYLFTLSKKLPADQSRGLWDCAS